MRGDLDETLARMARREEALRRRVGTPDDEGDVTGPAEPTRGAYRLRGGTPPAAREPVGSTPVLEPVGQPPVVREPGGNTPAVRDPVEEVAEAVRRVVAEHPGLAVTLRVEHDGRAYPLRVEHDGRAYPLRVEHDGRAYPLRVSWAGPDVTVGEEAVAKPPPAWPMSAKTVPAWTPGRDGPGVDPAARLAEMIRRDPSLLEDTGPLP
ncbi:hypothetical protein ACFO0M_09745 [Micromonospora mangrovi]|uniref:Uncharacterized protein n=2 Tax=Micromonospora TaxID=1873 RepID=A0AAU8HEW7_9ACTN